MIAYGEPKLAVGPAVAYRDGGEFFTRGTLHHASMRQVQEHDPETWKPVFDQDHARNELRRTFVVVLFAPS